MGIGARPGWRPGHTGRPVGAAGRWSRSGVLVPVVLLLAFLSACSAGPDEHAHGPGTAPTLSDVAYASSSPSEVLDLWVPTTGRRPFPLVIFLHGGGFSGGDKRDVGAKVPALLGAGFAVASVNYRLSGEARFPAAAQDAKAAVRHLRARAATYGLDAGRFAVWGESAGANLAVLVGTTGGRPTVLDDPALGDPALGDPALGDPALGDTGVPDTVQAVVDWYGPTDFARRERQLRAGGSECRRPQIAQADGFTTGYLGADVDSVPRRAAEASPVTYLPTAPSLPAFSVAHGTADCLVPLAQSTLLVDALRASGSRPDVHVLDGATHGDPRFDRELLGPTISWLGAVLDGQGAATPTR